MKVSEELKLKILGLSLLTKLNTTGASDTEIQYRIYELDLENKLEYYFGKKDVSVRDVLLFFNFIQGTRKINDSLCSYCQTIINTSISNTSDNNQLKVYLKCGHWCHTECLLLEKSGNSDNSVKCSCGVIISNNIIANIDEKNTIIEKYKRKRERQFSDIDELDDIEEQFRKKVKLV